MGETTLERGPGALISISAIGTNDVGVNVRVGVKVGVSDEVAEGMEVGVAVAAALDSNVAVGMMVAVGGAVAVAVGTMATVAMGKTVCDGVRNWRFARPLQLLNKKRNGSMTAFRIEIDMQGLGWLDL